MSFTIRAATKADEADWTGMRTALWPSVTPTENANDIARMLAEGWCCLIARDEDGGAIGFAETSLRRDYVNGCDTSPVAFIEGIYVRAEWRHRGVARALVGAVEDWARGQVRELASDALADNAQSRRFHAAMGFEETEQVVYFRKLLR